MLSHSGCLRVVVHQEVPEVLLRGLVKINVVARWVVAGGYGIELG